MLRGSGDTMREKSKPKKRRWILYACIIVILILVILYLLGRDKNKAYVEAHEVQKGSVEFTITAVTTGTVQADRSVTITPLFSGEVEEILVEVAYTAKKGEILLKLDREEAESQYQLASANLKNARIQLEKATTSQVIRNAASEADYDKAKAAYEKAKSDFQKFTELHSSGIISDQQLTEAKLELDVAKTAHESATAALEDKILSEKEIKAARALVEQMEAALKVSRINLERTEIKAPFDGIVAERFAELGLKVNPSTPLFTFVGGILYARASFDEVDVAHIENGQKVKLKLDSFPNKDFLGEIYEISPVVSTDKLESRSATVKIKFLKNNNKIRHGMSVDAEILAGAKENILFVPTDSIMIRKGIEYVYIVEDGRAVKREIETGLSNWEKTEVINGLQGGDLVITSLDVDQLQEKGKVKIIKK